VKHIPRISNCQLIFFKDGRVVEKKMTLGANAKAGMDIQSLPSITKRAR